MTNYKHVGYNYTNFGAVQLAHPPSRELLTLFFNFGTTNNEKSLFNSVTNLVYVVPSGKTFTLVGIVADLTNSSPARLIYESATQDAKTTEKLNIGAPLVAGRYFYTCKIDFAEDTYVTYDPVLAGSPHIQMVGYET